MTKRSLILPLAMLMAVACFGKDIKTLRVTTEPRMVCQNCENKIKKNLRFEKGVQEITTDLDTQTVTLVYDADKTTEEKLVEAFGKIKYTARIVEDECEHPSPCEQREERCVSDKEKSGGCCGNKR